jgi:hypothetical protein
MGYGSCGPVAAITASLAILNFDKFTVKIGTSVRFCSATIARCLRERGGW